MNHMTAFPGNHIHGHPDFKCLTCGEENFERNFRGDLYCVECGEKYDE